MASLKLWFTLDASLALERSEFSPNHSAGKPLPYDQHNDTFYSIRGNSTLPPALSNSAHVGTFTWSAAVQALCILLLRHCASSVQASSPRPSSSPSASSNGGTLDLQLTGAGGSISGAQNTAAASLDYALTKQPAWLLDMFGTTAGGISKARSLFKRLNPERKRAGPVVVAVNAQALLPEDISIFIGGEACENSETLLEHARDLEAKWGVPAPTRILFSSDATPVMLPVPVTSSQLPNRVDGRSLSSSFDVASDMALREVYGREVRHVLLNTDIFNPSRFRELKRKAVQNPSFVRLAGKMGKYLVEVDEQLSTTDRLGVSSEEPVACDMLRNCEPISVATSPAHVGSLVLLKYLKLKKNYNVEVNFKVAHSVEMARRMLTQSFVRAPEICSLTIATAGSTLGRGVTKHYKPFMVMPQMTHGTVAARMSDGKTPPIDRGEFLFMSEMPATESFHFDELLRRKLLHRSKVKVRNTEPDEAALMLHDGDSTFRAIIGFPYYYFNAALNNCVLLDNPLDPRNAQETIFFARSDFVERDPRAHYLKIALRDAWLALRETPNMIDELVRLLIEDEAYMGFLRRCVGIHNFAPFTAREVAIGRGPIEKEPIAKNQAGVGPLKREGSIYRSWATK